MDKSISLCMIVKDESAFLEQTLQSVAPIVSQIVVVDTGSTDETVEIARRNGAEVFHFEWQDNFALARNFSLEKASGDWILVLDGDEAIASEELPIIRKQIAHANTCWLMSQRHYTNDARLSGFLPVKGDYPSWEKDCAGYFESKCVRLFPNDPRIRFRGRVHELVEHSIREHAELRIIESPVRIQHYGHVPGICGRESKGHLYSELGRAKLDEQPQDWKSYYELAVEHNLAKRYSESIAAFKKSIELNPRFITSYINLGYVQCEAADYAGAELTLTRAIQIDPQNAEAYCNLGVVRLREKRFGESEKLLRKALELNPNYINAYSNLSIVFLRCNRISEAVSILERMLELSPSYVPALAQLGGIYASFEMFEKAEKYFVEALRIEPDAPHLAQMLKDVREER